MLLVSAGVLRYPKVPRLAIVLVVCVWITDVVVLMSYILKLLSCPAIELTVLDPTEARAVVELIIAYTSGVLTYPEDPSPRTVLNSCVCVTPPGRLRPMAVDNDEMA
jgi:hypothetical protein